MLLLRHFSCASRVAVTDEEDFASSLERRVSELSLDAQAVQMQPPKAQKFPDASDADVAAALNKRLAASAAPASSTPEGVANTTPQVDLNAPLTGELVP